MTEITTPAIPEARQQKFARSRQRQLGKALAQLYASVTTEPVPDDFMQLMLQIDAKTTANRPV